MVLETERLILREMRQNDFKDLAEILQNPRVMYAYEHDFSEKDVQEWLDRQIERYKKYGFGLWAVILMFEYINKYCNTKTKISQYCYVGSGLTSENFLKKGKKHWIFKEYII